MNTIVNQFESVNKLAQYDKGPGKYRIGLIVLSNDYVTERDFMNMRPSDDVAIFTNRIPFAPDCTVETLGAMAPQITATTDLIVPDGHLDVVVYSCTSGTAVMGFDNVQSRIQSSRPGIPCVTPLTAAIDALNQFGAQRLAVLTPYVDGINTVIAETLRESGKSISAFTSFKLQDTEAMAQLSPDSIYQAALSADRDDADALFISCTAIRAVDVVEKIEQKLGKPVVSSVQALFWQALKFSGYTGIIPGYGRLFSNDFTMTNTS